MSNVPSLSRPRPAHRSLAIGLLLVHTLALAGPPPTERIQWDRIPIRLDLQIGSERRVSFPGPVSLGLPAVLQSKLRVQSVDGTLYLLARQPFGPARVLVRETGSGRIYLFDIEASDDAGALPPMEIGVADPIQKPPAPATGPEAAGPRRYGYVGLTRFAARQLYAPARLLGDWPGIVRMPVKRDPVALYRGGAIEALPLAAWRSGGLHVTAVRLRNRSDTPRDLDPRDLRGAWLTATYQHNRLLPAGDEADTTAVYLVSARPFAASL